MTWTSTPLHSRFGARLTGVDLGADPSAEDLAELVDNVEANGLVVLTNQVMDDQAMLRLAEGLGEIDSPGMKVNIQLDPVSRITNMTIDGDIVPFDNRMFQIDLANELWHTDGTYTRPGTKFSFLHARICAPVGAETEFCDTRVAYEALEPGMQDRLRSLSGLHSLVYSRRKAGFEAWTAKELAGLETVARPLVQEHVPSGRLAMCLASHIGAIEGMGDDEAVQLIDQLIANATLPELIYSHRWAPYDLLMWDNRCTMHRARPFDYRRHGRDLRSVRVTDPDAPHRLVGVGGHAAASLSQTRSQSSHRQPSMKVRPMSRRAPVQG
jgi:alpha-ketoglutarate-dependent 2,4-dichlorophenoxyacetate dioxygenase